MEADAWRIFSNMKIRLWLLAIAITVPAILTGFVAHSAFAADVCESDIRPLNDRLLDAFTKRDIPGLMSLYVQDNSLIVFDDSAMMLTGPAEVRANFAEFFKTVTRIRVEIRKFNCAVHGDIALVTYLIPTSWADGTGDHQQTTRYTQVLIKKNSKWLIQHEHLSVPYDPLTGKAQL